MAWGDSDQVAQTVNGDDGSFDSSSSGWDSSLVRMLAQLKRRNPLAGTLLAKVGSKAPSTTDDSSVVMPTAGAGQDSTGPNGPGMSSPRLPAKSKSTPLQVTPETPNDTSAPAPDVGAVAPPSPLPRDIASGPTSLPALDQQGGSNKFVRFLSRLSGMTAAEPKPGELYTGPTTTEEKVGALARFAGAIGNAGALATGTPEQQQLAQQRIMLPQQLSLERQKLANETSWRRAMVGINQQKADTGDEKAQADRLRTLGGLRAKGMTVDEQGNVRPMTEDEILAGPTLSSNQQMRQAAFESKQAQAALARAHQDAISNPNNPTFQQRERQIQAQLAMAQQRLELARSGQDLSQQRFGLQSREEGLKIFQPALDSEERLKVMRENYVDGLKGDQQAMLSLLSNHLGMTMGLQKGARLNQAIISEAQQSRPWLQGLKAKFDQDGYLTGVTLTPEQMRQMVSLGEDRFRADVSKSRRSASMVGINGEPQWEVDPDADPEALPKSLGELGYSAARKAAPNSFNAGAAATTPSGKSLSVDDARQYLRRAGGDRNKAESMARRDGRTF